MYYQFCSGLQQISIRQIDPDVLTVGFLSLEELDTDYLKLKLPRYCVDECRTDPKHFRNSFDVYDTFSIGLLTIPNLGNLNLDEDKLAFIIQKNLFLMISISDTDKKNEQEFIKAAARIDTNPTLEKFIFCVFEHLTAGSNLLLEKTGNTVLALEQEILENRPAPSMNHIIFNLKKSMTVCRNYYGELADFIEAVQDNENNILPGDNFRYLKIINDRITRLGTKTQMLYDNLIHLREIYQSSLDYDLNNIMKLFTVVTTIFLPLTLIVGWYGMNFTSMPELHWKYGYLCVIIISIIIILLCLWFFKKKKLL